MSQVGDVRCRSSYLMDDLAVTAKKFAGGHRLTTAPWPSDPVAAACRTSCRPRRRRDGPGGSGRRITPSTARSGSTSPARSSAASRSRPGSAKAGRGPGGDNSCCVDRGREARSLRPTSTTAVRNVGLPVLAIPGIRLDPHYRTELSWFRGGRRQPAGATDPPRPGPSSPPRDGGARPPTPRPGRRTWPSAARRCPAPGTAGETDPAGEIPRVSAHDAIMSWPRPGPTASRNNPPVVPRPVTDFAHVVHEGGDHDPAGVRSVSVSPEPVEVGDHGTGHRHRSGVQPPVASAERTPRSSTTPRPTRRPPPEVPFPTAARRTGGTGGSGWSSGAFTRVTGPPFDCSPTRCRPARG